MRARIILPLLALFAVLPSGLRADTKPACGVRVVVLDAGHGGNDPGAHYAGVYEKDLTLKVVLRLGRRIEREMPGVEVVYTRKTDKALAPTKREDLQRRADIANRANGDLFLSVHVNAARSPSAQGVETLVMGESPKEQQYNEEALFDTNRDELIDMSDKREAAIVRAYIQNLQFTYGEHSLAMARCIQNNYVRVGRQSRGVKPQLLRVLYATNMPGVLTEIGFLSNKEEAAFLKSDKGIDRIVDALFRSVNDYSAYLLETRRIEAEGAGGTAEDGEAPAAASKASGTSGAAASSASAAPETSAAAASTPSKKEPAAGTAKGGSRRGEREAKRSERRQPKTSEEAPKLYDPRLYNGHAAADASAGNASGTASGSASGASEKKSDRPAGGAKQTAVRYTVQVLASRKSVSAQSSEFKEYRGRVRRYEGTEPYKYRYGVGEYATRAEALQAASVVRSTFPKAFVTAVQGNRVVVPKK